MTKSVEKPLSSHSSSRRIILIWWGFASPCTSLPFRLSVAEIATMTATSAIGSAIDPDPQSSPPMELRTISIIAEVTHRDAMVRCAKTSPFPVLANVPMDIQRRVATPQKLTDRVSRMSTSSVVMHAPRGAHLRGLG
jgi:hypothetical protein